MPRIPIAASCPRPGGWSAIARRAGPMRRNGGVVRVDDGVVEGGEVSMFYDPMIAKLITWAPTRDEAIDRQIAALDALRDRGPRPQYRFPLRDHAAPALPRGRAHHRLHRRGISRRLPRRAGGRRAARRELAAIAGIDRHGDADRARARSAASSARPVAAAERLGRADRRRASIAVTLRRSTAA